MIADVVRNDAAERYEMNVAGGLAIATFRLQGNVLLLTHTEVPHAARGKGAASRLIEGVLEDVRARRLKVRPLCSFVQRYMADHPETIDLLAS